LELFAYRGETYADLLHISAALQNIPRTPFTLIGAREFMTGIWPLRQTA